MDAPLITDGHELTELVSRWRSERTIAVDTEASSFHRYRVRLCLIQLSTSSGTWLIDPFKVDLSPLLELIQDKSIEIVFHDADFDIRLFHREHGIRIAPIFDTRIAAQLIGEEHFSLASLLEKYLGHKLDKKFQKADWSMRPLPRDMLDYAACDTHFLLELRSVLLDRLKHMGREHWAEEEFRRIPDIPFLDDGPKDPSWLRIKWAKSLKGLQLAILKEVHTWREGEAERRDRAPFMIIPNHTLIEIAKTGPESVSQLLSLEGASERLTDRYGKQILDSVKRAKRYPKEDWPVLEKPKRFKRDEEYDDRLKRLKDIRDRESERLGIAQGVLTPNTVLAIIAREKLGSIDQLKSKAGMRSWQIQEAGEELLSVV